ncbi:MAG: putative O-glycosylation ligase, exosortase A system-associated [Magnetococcales bacterium]|nr:putative O-glycosylation ligase, exosortase A system-associated [Magnetococcales bacterium]
MRDLFLTLFIFGMLPGAFFRPHIGVYLWAWVAYMNPHRLTWSYAYNFRFNYFIAIATILGIIVFWNKTVKIPRNYTVYFLYGFLVWTAISSLNAINYPWHEWQQLVKIYMMITATFLLIDSKKAILTLVTIITLSIGYFGIKGGVFTITTGGQFQVLGPARSFFSDNNMFALAELMVVPMFLFLRTQLKNFWLRWLFVILALLAALSVIGSYSRGGLVGLIVITLYFWLRTPGKIRIALLLAMVMPLAYNLMSERWQYRMISMVEKVEIPKVVTEYFSEPALFDPENDPFPEDEESDELIVDDSSVAGRIQAWTLAYRVAIDRPFVGGGFRTFHLNVFRKYLPGAQRRAAHSIYFQVLGEHGFVGFAVWTFMHLTGFLTRNRIMKKTKNIPELLWAHELARFIGISMIGYYASGAFLGLAYFDLPLHYISILVIIQTIVLRELSKIETPPPKKEGRFPFRSIEELSKN